MWCGCVWEVDGYKGLCGVCRFLADKMGSKVAYQNGTFLSEDDPRQQRSVVLPYDRRGGFRVSENLRIHLAIEKHSFGDRRKVTIYGSVAPKNDVLSFSPRRLFFYRVY